MLRLFAILLALPTLVHGQNPNFNFKNAGDYNNFIMQEMTQTVQKNFEYISFSVHSDEYDKLEVKRKEVVEEIVKAKENVRQMPPLEGDTRLRDEAVAVLGEYQRAFELDYKDMIGLKQKSRDSYESMQAYFEAEDKAEAKVNMATKQLRKAQQDYATKHNVNVVDNKADDVLEQKMNKVIAVNNYWRAIFLQYFKISEQYDKMWEALPEKKAHIIDRERLGVLKVIDQVLPELKQVPEFNDDREFRDQTINITEYFQRVATDSFHRIVDILSKKQLTQGDIDEVNAIINKCNSDHERLFYNWNIASQDLFRKNVDRE